MISLKAAPVS